jgi:hypothetical protein
MLEIVSAGASCWLMPRAQFGAKVDGPVAIASTGKRPDLDDQAVKKLGAGNYWC